ncbi:MAG: DsrE family protein [Alphaproteobacteria bacterium]|uniref:DsrE family protein n=1 Tax=Candidatus Nitrobium versatile TaxID=2884831 RepID=A0A953LZA0_9BACT|nr:DsrE family protein [Candidatus Nitrobium versatile]
MKIGIIIHSSDPETVWNAFRYGAFVFTEGDEAEVFLTGKGVEAESLDSGKYPVLRQMRDFVAAGGAIRTCRSCLELRNAGATELCPIGGLKDMHALIKECDRVVTF